MKLRDILAQLRHIYCGTIGAEFAHVSDSKERLWLQDRFQEGRVRSIASRPTSAEHRCWPPDCGRRARALSRDASFRRRSASRSKAATRSSRCSTT